LTAANQCIPALFDLLDGAMKGGPVAAGGFEPCGVQLLGRRLHRVDRVDADCDQVRQDREDAAVGVVNPKGVGGQIADACTELLRAGLDEAPVHGGRNQQVPLGAQVVGCFRHGDTGVAPFATDDPSGSFGRCQSANTG